MFANLSTPQIWFDFMTNPTPDGGLWLDFVVNESIFIDGVVEKMWNATNELIQKIVCQLPGNFRIAGAHRNRHQTRIDIFGNFQHRL